MKDRGPSPVFSLYQNSDIEKVRQLLTQYGLQLPTPLKLSDSNITISQENGDVNTNISTKSENNTDMKKYWADVIEQQRSSKAQPGTENQSLQNEADGGIIADDENSLRSENDVIPNQRAVEESGREHTASETTRDERIKQIRRKNFNKNNVQRSTSETAEAFAERASRDSSKSGGKKRTLLNKGNSKYLI